MGSSGSKINEAAEAISDYVVLKRLAGNNPSLEEDVAKLKQRAIDELKTIF